MKTVNVKVTIQLDINPKGGLLTDVQKAMDFINETLQSATNFNYEAQIFTNAIDESDITVSSHGFEVGDEVEVPEPNETDLHNHSFVGTIIDFRGENAVIEDGEGNSFEIEADRL